VESPHWGIKPSSKPVEAGRDHFALLVNKVIIQPKVYKDRESESERALQSFTKRRTLWSMDENSPVLVNLAVHANISRLAAVCC
jgi:hypothetical protein